MSVGGVLLLSALASGVVGVLAIAVAVRERRAGSKWWVVPGAFGGVLLVWGLLKAAAVVLV